MSSEHAYYDGVSPVPHFTEPNRATYAAHAIAAPESVK
jgi:hypothetical protein